MILKYLNGNIRDTYQNIISIDRNFAKNGEIPKNGKPLKNAHQLEKNRKFWRQLFKNLEDISKLSDGYFDATLPLGDVWFMYYLTDSIIYVIIYTNIFLYSPLEIRRNSNLIFGKNYKNLSENFVQKISGILFVCKNKMIKISFVKQLYEFLWPLN